MKLKPRVPEENRERPEQIGNQRAPLSNDGSEGRPKRSCEPSAKRTSGRFIGRASDPSLTKPENLSVTPMNRGGGCAVDVLCLTRGGPSKCWADNYDRAELREAARWIDASGGIRRTHSSRKTSSRRRPERSGQRVKLEVSDGERSEPLEAKGGTQERARRHAQPLEARPRTTQPDGKETRRTASILTSGRSLIFERKLRAAWSN